MIKIDVGTDRVIARFGDHGIPDVVRKNLKRIIPDLTRRLGALAEDNLIGSVDSWTNIAFKKEMIEDPSNVTGKVSVQWTGDRSKMMVPKWIEEGTRAHVITASGAYGGPGPKALFFYWKGIGAYWSGKEVHNPGVRARNYMKRAVEAMTPEIKEALIEATMQGVREKT